PKNPAQIRRSEVRRGCPRAARAGAVCSKTREAAPYRCREALLMNRCASRISERSALRADFEQTAPVCAFGAASPPNLGGEWPCSEPELGNSPIKPAPTSGAPLGLRDTTRNTFDVLLRIFSARPPAARTFVLRGPRLCILP